MKFAPIVEHEQSVTHDGALARSVVSDASRFNVGPGRGRGDALLSVIRDSREQHPYAFAGLPVVVTVAALAVGDYSLAGFEGEVAVERKSMADLVHCLAGDRERFSRQLARMRDLRAVAVVVEGAQYALRTGRYLGGLNPSAAWQTVLAFTQRYRVPFIFAGDRADAEEVTYDFLRHFHRDRMRDGRAGA